MQCIDYLSIFEWLYHTFPGWNWQCNARDEKTSYKSAMSKNCGCPIFASLSVSVGSTRLTTGTQGLSELSLGKKYHVTKIALRTNQRVHTPYAWRQNVASLTSCISETDDGATKGRLDKNSKESAWKWPKCSETRMHWRQTTIFNTAGNFECMKGTSYAL